MKIQFVFDLILCLSIISAQEEITSNNIQDIITPDTSIIDTSTSGEEVETLGMKEKTVTNEIGELDTTEQVTMDTTQEEIEIPPTLDAGYKGFGWGMTKVQFHRYINLDSASYTEIKDAIQFRGLLGEDSVTFSYYFSDIGFWKVKIQFDVIGDELDDYINQFKRVEKYLTKRYGAPEYTTRNEMGIDREYIFSNFPKLTHAYFRSSWLVDLVNVELLLTAHVPAKVEGIPVFQDLKPLLLLYYYHPSYYEVVIPDTTKGISEEEVLESY